MGGQIHIPPNQPTDHTYLVFIWTQVGEKISVYARDLVVYDADAATRSWYESNGLELRQKVNPPEDETVTVERAIPPYIGDSHSQPMAWITPVPTNLTLLFRNSDRLWIRRRLTDLLRGKLSADRT